MNNKAVNTTIQKYRLITLIDNYLMFLKQWNNTSSMNDETKSVFKIALIAHFSISNAA